jgi:tetratricopeptide (TPR) repeat protein
MRVMRIHPAFGAAAFAALLGSAHAAPDPQPAPAPAPAIAPDQQEAEPLPVPPVPPRIAEGQDYEGCLAMLTNDPAGANAFADAWEATGGGDGALHCHALAQITLGNPQVGADMLEKLAAGSAAPALARAQVYGQAVQAWLIADDPDRAFGAATLALSLSPDDEDLLIDRSIASAEMNRFLDAIDDLNRALDLEPRRADALVLRAAGWRHESRLDLAQDDVDRALAIDPDNAEAYLERGILRERAGDRAGAQADWDHAIELGPDSTTADLAQQNLALLEAGPSRR